ncbi:hypothetical protein FJW04_23635 [Mesorhizobium sp. B2-7-3]|uniref:hypothetical protein n=1 Tax=Mesorhizobium sp. B2-7-3 TaxID=2589907 RepID=UPI00112985C8|nr:hypothetical protein [Mesorhizobium sp. B2-7-3]TPJ12233.1 hypothetical protein FJW04_23635 [Mesorhizobium sp. B2-7-3]
MSKKEFVPLNLLAKSAGISRQAVWKACQRGDWRGHALEVRVVQGKGGNAGKHYLVNLASLPPELQLRLKPIETTFEKVRSRLHAEAGTAEPIKARNA